MCRSKALSSACWVRIFTDCPRRLSRRLLVWRPVLTRARSWTRLKFHLKGQTHFSTRILPSCPLVVFRIRTSSKMMNQRHLETWMRLICLTLSKKSRTWMAMARLTDTQPRNSLELVCQSIQRNSRQAIVYMEAVTVATLSCSRLWTPCSTDLLSSRLCNLVNLTDLETALTTTILAWKWITTATRRLTGKVSIQLNWEIQDTVFTVRITEHRWVCDLDLMHFPTAHLTRLWFSSPRLVSYSELLGREKRVSGDEWNHAGALYMSCQSLVYLCLTVCRTMKRQSSLFIWLRLFPLCI